MKRQIDKFNIIIKTFSHLLCRINLLLFRRRTWSLMPRSVIRFMNYTVQITDGPNFYMQYKDEFINRIYQFDAVRQNPLIIDGGSNIGMSILYFKRIYPDARIIGFEPDPDIYQLLNNNLSKNNI